MSEPDILAIYDFDTGLFDVVLCAIDARAVLSAVEHAGEGMTEEDREALRAFVLERAPELRGTP